MIGYITKDKDGEIFLHTEKPTYDSDFVGWFSSDPICVTRQFPEFEDMSYKDEPIKVEITLERI